MCFCRFRGHETGRSTRRQAHSQPGRQHLHPVVMGLPQPPPYFYRRPVIPRQGARKGRSPKPVARLDNCCRMAPVGQRQGRRTFRQPTTQNQHTVILQIPVVFAWQDIGHEGLKLAALDGGIGRRIARAEILGHQA